MPEHVALIENDNEARWQVVEGRVELNDAEALADATHVHSRKEVPVAWALPLAAPEERAGRFWAFFATDTPSRVPGILNVAMEGEQRPNRVRSMDLTIPS